MLKNIISTRACISIPALFYAYYGRAVRESGCLQRGTRRAPLSLYGKKQACVVGGCSICFCFMSVFSFTPRLLFHCFLFLLNFLLLASVMPFSFLPYHFYFTSFFKNNKQIKSLFFFPKKKRKKEEKNWTWVWKFWIKEYSPLNITKI